MSWVRVEDNIYDHPKIRAAGPLGFALHVAGIIWCNRNLTDGHLPRQVVRTVWDWTGCEYDPYAEQLETSKEKPLCLPGSDQVSGIYVADWLVDLHLWHAASHGCARCEQPITGDFVIHDYLVYQPSAEEVRAAQQQTSTAATKAAHERWHVGRGRTNPNCPHCVPEGAPA